MTPKQYQEQWATLTGRSEREVYVPEALRGFVPVAGARVRDRDGLEATILSVGPTGTCRVRWDDGPVSHEGVDENGVVL